MVTKKVNCVALEGLPEQAYSVLQCVDAENLAHWSTLQPVRGHKVQQYDRMRYDRMKSTKINARKE